MAPRPTRRALHPLALACALSTLILGVGLAVGVGGAGATSAPVLVPTTGTAAEPANTSASDGEEATTVTLAGGRSMSECVSALPKPGCTTTTTTDGKMVALFGVMVAGLAVVGWRIVRGVRRRDVPDERFASGGTTR